MRVVGSPSCDVEGAERKSSGSTAASNNAVSLRNKSLRESWSSSSSSKPLKNMNPLESTRERKKESYILQRHPPGGVACREGKTRSYIMNGENRQVILFFSFFSCLRLCCCCCCCRYCYSRSLLLTSHFPSDPEDFDHISLGQLLRWRDLIATPHPREHGKQPDVAFFFFSLCVPLASCFS